MLALSPSTKETGPSACHAGGQGTSGMVGRGRQILSFLLILVAAFHFFLWKAQQKPLLRKELLPNPTSNVLTDMGL